MKTINKQQDWSDVTEAVHYLFRNRDNPDEHIEIHIGYYNPETGDSWSGDDPHRLLHVGVFADRDQAAKAIYEKWAWTR